MPSALSFAICDEVPNTSICLPRIPSVTSKPAMASFSRFCGDAFTR
jgi:hypothetical protein